MKPVIHFDDATLVGMYADGLQPHIVGVRLTTRGEEKVAALDRTIRQFYAQAA
jgi:hypothetical protein